MALELAVPARGALGAMREAPPFAFPADRAGAAALAEAQSENAVNGMLYLLAASRAVWPAGNDLGVSAANMAVARIWLYDLCLAQQQGQLSRESVRSYFIASRVSSVPANCIPIIVYVASAIPTLVIGRDTLQRAAEFEWLRYRITFSSTADLCQRSLESPHVVGLLDDGQEEAIAASLAAPSDRAANRAITARTRVICGEYLKSVRALPDGWKQYERALQEVSPGFTMRVTAVFRKALEVDTRLEEIRGAENDAQLVGLLERI